MCREARGLTVARSELARTPEEAGALSERLGLPVALKVSSGDISHKTDVGGVRLGLASAADVTAAAGALLARVREARPAARIDGVLVQRMVAGGVELLLGMVRDPQFGPLVVVGFGGIYVEVLGDTAARLAPFGQDEARRMVGELRMAPAPRAPAAARPWTSGRSRTRSAGSPVSSPTSPSWRRSR